MIILALFVGIGAFIGGFRGYRIFSANTARNLAQVRAVEIVEGDVASRQVRAQAIGYIRGTYLSGVAVYAALGAAVGLLVGIAWLSLRWVLP